MSSSIIKKIVLIKTIDWNTWYSFVKIKAINNEIWDFINPKLFFKSIFLKFSNESKLNMIGEVTSRIFELYKIACQVYKIKLTKYEKQMKAFDDIIIYIQKTISVQCAKFIIKNESHSWNYFRTFKQHFAFSDEARGLKIEERYHRFCKKSDLQNLDTWLQKWMTTYNDEKTYEIVEIIGKRTARDFLKIIKSKKLNFVDNQMLLLTKQAIEDVDVYSLIEEFR